ncbi:unnamed protein product [Caenorhabditis auriculariae]|uniref:GOLD domain-containing protein n=1 Tax=Caenorhabditis auriculariae TaxID=2777116 RepID=A0A8S1HW36_9PELO|nr:unnamed protein product [Caenorhabditis auriculariae]
MFRVLLLIFCLSQLLLAYSDSNTYLQFVVPHGQKFCFFLSFDKRNYASMDIEVQVKNGFEQEIDFYVVDPTGEEIFRGPRSSKIRQTIPYGQGKVMVKGDYQLCADNIFSYYSNKEVVVDVRFLDSHGSMVVEDDNPENMIKREIDARRTVGVIPQRLNSLFVKLSESYDLLHKLRAIYFWSREQAEENFEQINFWGVINTFVMIFAALAQVYLVRSLLTYESKIGRYLRSPRF